MNPFPFDSPGFTSGRDVQEARIKIAAIFGIFFVSLFAVSFPTASKRSSLLRIPHVVFFIGKHFGTGIESNLGYDILLTFDRRHSFYGVLPSAARLLRASSEPNFEEGVSQSRKKYGLDYVRANASCFRFR
jgi:hypothetical protein